MVISRFKASLCYRHGLFISVVLAIGRLRWVDCSGFAASLGYIVRLLFQKARANKRVGELVEQGGWVLDRSEAIASLIPLYESTSSRSQPGRPLRLCFKILNMLSQHQTSYKSLFPAPIRLTDMSYMIPIN